MPSTNRYPRWSIEGLAREMAIYLYTIVTTPTHFHATIQNHAGFLGPEALAFTDEALGIRTELENEPRLETLASHVVRINGGDNADSNVLLIACPMRLAHETFGTIAQRGLSGIGRHDFESYRKLGDLLVARAGKQDWKTELAANALLFEQVFRAVHAVLKECRADWEEALPKLDGIVPREDVESTLKEIYYVADPAMEEPARIALVIAARAVTKSPTPAAATIAKKVPRPYRERDSEWISHYLAAVRPVLF